jgi:hypothetical protein
MRHLGRAVAFLATAGALAAPSAAAGPVTSEAGPAQTSISLPARGAFYYPWYPEVWNVNGFFPHYEPGLGFYNSADAAVVDQHIAALDYAHVDVAIASWWGIGTHEEALRIPLLLDRTSALGSPLRWALYYEKESHDNPTVAELQSDLAYIGVSYASSPQYALVKGKPVLFVYNWLDEACELAGRWSEAAGTNWYVVLLVLPGYRSCLSQPDSWHDYKPAHAEDSRPGYSFSISPGFWKADEAAPRLVRDLSRWRENIRHMVGSNAPWQLITTFNEWGEGTAVERAADWSSGAYGDYVEALHQNGGVPTALTVRKARAVRRDARSRLGVLSKVRSCRL